MDVSDDASVEQAIESIVGITGRLDVVVNNAGVAYWGPLEAFTLDQAQHQFDTNVFGMLRVNRAVLPHMRRQRLRFVPEGELSVHRGRTQRRDVALCP